MIYVYHFSYTINTSDNSKDSIDSDTIILRSIDEIPPEIDLKKQALKSRGLDDFISTDCVSVSKANQVQSYTLCIGTICFDDGTTHEVSPLDPVADNYVSYYLKARGIDKIAVKYNLKPAKDKILYMHSSKPSFLSMTAEEFSVYQWSNSNHNGFKLTEFKPISLVKDLL